MNEHEQWAPSIANLKSKMIIAVLYSKQVKPGFTNYLPRGLAQKIESFQSKALKIFKKPFNNIQKCPKKKFQKIWKMGEIFNG